MSLPIAAELRAAVKKRARGRCEYCGIPDSATLFAHEADHIIAEQHQGLTDFENLALACFHCNRHKGPNIATINPRTGEIIRLFNPRTDRWMDHFRFNGAKIVPQSDMGNATATLLQFNSTRRLEARRLLISTGFWDSDAD